MTRDEQIQDLTPAGNQRPSLARLESLLAVADPQLASRAIATAAALRWLETSCADTEDEWRMAAAKASEWLERNRHPAFAAIEAEVLNHA